VFTQDEAIIELRTNPKYSELVRDSYLSEDNVDNAERFYQSYEFMETLRLLPADIRNKSLLELGSGTGMASYAFAKVGVKSVYALEPDQGTVVGLGSMKRLLERFPFLEIRPISGVAENIPLKSHSIDVVYARQTLHHIMELPRAMKEVSRVLRPGGIFLACREHVVKNKDDLEKFLASHPVHQMSGTENAYLLEQYTQAIEMAGLSVKKVFYPYESVINAFPMCKTPKELDKFHYNSLRKLPLVREYIHKWALLQKYNSRRFYGGGAMFTFWAKK
jgi:ubiquinone/menaquinone biosynthesis C-methylase UbiE